MSSGFRGRAVRLRWSSRPLATGGIEKASERAVRAGADLSCLLIRARLLPAVCTAPPRRLPESSRRSRARVRRVACSSCSRGASRSRPLLDSPRARDEALRLVPLLERADRCPRSRVIQTPPCQALRRTASTGLLALDELRELESARGSVEPKFAGSPLPRSTTAHCSRLGRRRGGHVRRLVALLGSSSCRSGPAHRARPTPSSAAACSR